MCRFVAVVDSRRIKLNTYSGLQCCDIVGRQVLHPAGLYDICFSNLEGSVLWTQVASGVTLEKIVG